MIVRLGQLPAMEPLGLRRSIYAHTVAGETIYAHLLRRAAARAGSDLLKIYVSDPLLADSVNDMQAISEFGSVGVELDSPTANSSENLRYWTTHGESLEFRYPWHLLAIASEILADQSAGISKDAEVESGVEIEGNVRIESGARVLGGTRIKGNVYIGSNAFIGNSCMLRGDLSIGADSIIGFTADVKASVLMERVGVGPLAFVADSIVEQDCMFGGMARISNYRLDGREVDVEIDGDLVTTGRRQFGAIVGANSQIGVGCIVLPGRKIGPESLVEPNVTVIRNVPERKRVALVQDISVSNR